MTDVVNGGRRGLLAIAGFTFAAMAAAPAFASRLLYFRTARCAEPHKTWTLETAALAHLREHKVDDAIALLEAAVDHELTSRHGLVSLRLLDLLATVYARKGRLEKLSALADRVEAAAESAPRVQRAEIAMLGRAANWRNEHSKWRRHRANAGTTVKWRWTKHETSAAGKYESRDDIVIPV